jgi:chromosome partitioning protein
MAMIAIYSMKGGVGKTTIAVNLAWASATLSNRRTLLWDLDAQAASTFILAPKRPAGDEARAVLERDIEPEDIIIPTGIAGLDLIPADSSLRGLDVIFTEIGRKKRLLRLTEQLVARYDRIILDCPPGLGVTSEQIIRGSSLILLPMIPSVLSRRSYGEVRDHLDRHHKGQPPIFPVFTMVDRRRLGHLQTIAADPG